MGLAAGRRADRAAGPRLSRHTPRVASMGHARIRGRLPLPALGRPARRPSPAWPTACGRGDPYQTLQGITGSGKTATIAWMIEQVQRPTLIIEPNKSLAAQLSSELRELFPKNRVEFFVSYYDYYQPEAYLPRRTPTSRRTRPSTTRSTGCATPRRRRSSCGAT